MLSPFLLTLTDKKSLLVFGGLSTPKGSNEVSTLCNGEDKTILSRPENQGQLRKNLPRKVKYKSNTMLPNLVSP